MPFGRKQPSRLDSLANLGRVPVSAGPGIAAPPVGDLAATYGEIAQAIDGSTVGRVFLVTGSAPGTGATTVALNIAIAATRAGRRVLLIDGDERNHGLSRFLSTGRQPGFTELATGDAALAEAARMITLDDRTTFPLIPCGKALDDPSRLSALPAADAIETVAERADLVLIDAPPIGWNDATPHLAAHADGSILVTTAGANRDTVDKAIASLSEVGAAVVGYVTNRVG